MDLIMTHRVGHKANTKLDRKTDTGWTDRQAQSWTEGQMDTFWTERQTQSWTDRQMDTFGQKDGHRVGQ